MGSVTSTLFYGVPEVEMYHLYFSTLDPQVEGDKVDIFFPQPSEVEGITSLSYRLQFLRREEVVEEVSITGRYDRGHLRVEFQKHLITNLETTVEHLKLRHHKSIRFPTHTVELSEGGVIQFARDPNSRFVITAINGGYHRRSKFTDSWVVGVLDFLQRDIPICLEPWVVLAIRCHEGSLRDPIPFRLELQPPYLDTGYTPLSLSHCSHRYAVSEDKKIIIKPPVYLKIKWDDHHRGIISSWCPTPKFRCEVERWGEAPFYRWRLYHHEQVY